MDLNGAHVLITGASRGIGAALADAFAARGARLTLAARSLPGLEEVAARTGGTAVQADLADPGVVAGFIARIEEAHGPVDVLVNNAGIDLTGAFVDLSPEDLERIIRLNAITVADLTRQVLPGMVARGRGHVVQMSSLAATGVFPGMAVYAGTKAFLTHMSAGIRMELRGLPVGITVVEPGLVGPTDMKDSVLAYAPTAACFRRFYRLGLLADADVHALAARTVAAVERGKRHVRMPRRAWLFPWLNNAPRRIVEMTVAGIPPRER
ncbi:MAG: SDR family NAD(P)-dependent oxidoreductase [Thermoleophilia bacterium]